MSAVYVMSSLVPTTLNNIDPRKLSVFPNYLVIYTLHHYDPQLLTGLIVLVYYSKSQQLRDFFKREWLEMFRYFKKEWGYIDSWYLQWSINCFQRQSCHFLNGLTPASFFVYFPFSHQVEWNSDRLDMSRTLNLLDQHSCQFRCWTARWQKKRQWYKVEIVWVQLMTNSKKSHKITLFFNNVSV